LQQFDAVLGAESGLAAILVGRAITGWLSATPLTTTPWRKAPRDFFGATVTYKVLRFGQASHEHVVSIVGIDEVDVNRRFEELSAATRKGADVRLVACPRCFSTACRAGHPASRRCSSLKYRQYSRSSRLAIRAPRSGNRY
jgi:hypothetical protein